MFDPVIFENLKVALENQLYDLDNLDRKIRITGRKDRLDLATMSREFALFFQLNGSGRVTSEVHLEAPLADLAAEILETKETAPGCWLTLRYHLQVSDVPKQCGLIERVLTQVWEPELPPKQTLSFVYGPAPSLYDNMAEIRFDRKINEDQMNDLPDLIDHLLRSLRILEECFE